MCEIKEWVCYESWRVSSSLGLKDSDINCPVNLGGLIYLPLSGYTQSTDFKAITPGGWEPVEDEL